MISALLLFAFLNVENLNAEPWLANRNSQNCAGCHTPGRFNKNLMDRRCSLSCQGCHTNPQGGGLRNAYGKYNSQRWLRSFTSKTFKSVGRPLPTSKDSMDEKKKLSTEAWPLTLSMDIDEEDYDKFHDKNWETTLSTEIANEKIQQDDPFWHNTNNSVNTGFDFRYILGSQDGDNVNEQFKELNFPMALDLALELRPTIYPLGFVFETRSFNGPTNSDLENVFTQNTKFRSAYLIWDDLPYNSYIMYGLYRPLFGLSSPDHTTLHADITELNHYSVYKGLAIGTAPNIPFFNINLISPMLTSGYNSTSSTDEGFVATVGVRFVTYGLSSKISYWSTKRTFNAGTEQKQNDMLSFSIGAKLGRFILNFDGTGFEKVELDSSKNSGGVTTLEAKYRFYREMYLVTHFASSTTASDRTQGEASEVRLGVKSFLLSGIELELLGISRTETRNSTDSKLDRAQLQLHMYY